jgi:hypothetical protein
VVFWGFRGEFRPLHGNRWTAVGEGIRPVHELYILLSLYIYIDIYIYIYIYIVLYVYMYT